MEIIGGVDGEGNRVGVVDGNGADKVMFGVSLF